MRWQKRARWGLAAFGIVFAIIVYTAIGQRPTATPGQAPARLDPKAGLERIQAVFQQSQAARQDYVIEAERQLTYEGGATKFITSRLRSSSARGATSWSLDARRRRVTTGRTSRSAAT